MTEQELADYQARLLEQEAADVAAAKDEQLRLDKLYADTQAQEESLFKAEQERLNKELQDQIDKSNAELLAAQKKQSDEFESARTAIATTMAEQQRQAQAAQAQYQADQATLKEQVAKQEREFAVQQAAVQTQIKETEALQAASTEAFTSEMSGFKREAAERVASRTRAAKSSTSRSIMGVSDTLDQGVQGLGESINLGGIPGALGGATRLGGM
jgi:hypothetical protein